MDHAEIEAGNLVERYVLGRLPVEEQVRFEQHFAECNDCVEQLELARELSTGLREVTAEDARGVLALGFAAALMRHRRWLAPLALVLLLAPAIWLGLQNQRLRDDLADLRRPLANVPTFLLAVARDVNAPAPTLTIPADQDWLALTIEAEPGVESYDVRLENADGETLWQQSGLAPNLWDVVLLTLPRDLLPAGTYRLVMQASGGHDAGQPPQTYPFRIG